GKMWVFARFRKKTLIFTGIFIDNPAPPFYSSLLVKVSGICCCPTFCRGRSMANDNKAAGKARTKSETYQELANATGLTRKQVASVFDHLGTIVKADLG